MLPFSLIAFLGGLPVSLPAGAWELRTIGVGEISLGDRRRRAFLGIISTALAMVLWNTAFTLVDANLAIAHFLRTTCGWNAPGMVFSGRTDHTAFFVGRSPDRTWIGDFQFIAKAGCQIDCCLPFHAAIHDLFFSLQRYFMRGMLAGAVKG